MFVDCFVCIVGELEAGELDGDKEEELDRKVCDKFVVSGIVPFVCLSFSLVFLLCYWFLFCMFMFSIGDILH